MRIQSLKGLRRFQLNILGYGNSYYIKRIAKLEKALAQKPRRLQIDLIGEGEIPADSALLIRSILSQRSPKTHIITNARSSLQGGSVLVWLSGDSRLIRNDARLFFRRVNVSEDESSETETWKESDLEYSDSYAQADPEEADYARMLEVVNEFIPVKELAGRSVEVPTLRQFGLVENEKLDRFLAVAFGKTQQLDQVPLNKRKEKKRSSKRQGSQVRTD